MRYLSGIVAGLQTETNEIGYAAAFPISEVNRGINAFTLGVKSVNPDADVYIKWINSWVDDEAAMKTTNALLNNHNIDVLTIHTDSLAPLEIAEERGRLINRPHIFIILSSLFCNIFSKKQTGLISELGLFLNLMVLSPCPVFDVQKRQTFCVRCFLHSGY